MPFQSPVMCSGNKMQPPNPNVHMYVTGTNVKTHGEENFMDVQPAAASVECEM